MDNKASLSAPPENDLMEQINRCAAALDALQASPRHQVADKFALLYPKILELRGRKVTQKAILEVLAANGLKLHPARFKELMDLQANAIANATTSKDSK